ncbi:MAG: bifunctional phosphoribosylaminoimidazolecarboxamide formyltransferase/inosine monophosphate cyclohydrolase [Chloroflexi bacterium]|nr:MAG: bifunctional phosphoribosylaminoimidazolecarboxamide formyltransferase/inosine monophosphate cyclohydrolase [Chloroflexota bacterium]
MRALLSVSDREGIVELARGLVDAGVECFATDGTRAHLTEAGIGVRPVSELTDAAEILGGRVKTLHPTIFAGLLARRDQPDHLAQLAEHGIEQIDIVVVNLYPFGRTVLEPGITLDEALEQIDIGGVALLRAAAKNFPGVAAVSSPTQYASVVRDVKSVGTVSPETRQKLAADAFALTAGYDAQIASYLSLQAGKLFPSRLTLVFDKKADLRYGENPHQLGAFYADPSLPGATIANARQIAGKDLSFNNLLDLDAAWSIASDFKTPTVCIVKHGNPCGLASVVDLAEAFRLALEGDSVSAYGGIIGANRIVDESTARAIRPGFFEAIVAPGFTREALEILRTKKGFEIIEVPPSEAAERDGAAAFDFKRIGGGLLVQTVDSLEEDRDKLQVVTQRRPTLEELTDLLFSWRAVRHVKSNAIVLAKKHALIGMGAGQPSRVVSVEVALRKAGERAPLSVMASDAYFPFPDGIQIAAQAGVTAIIQPGGSIRDEMAIEVADRHHMAMVFTGRRHFRH